MRLGQMISEPQTTRTVALMPWGDVIEAYLDPIGVDLDGFANAMTGGWLFGYASALRHAGLRPIIICASQSVKQPTLLTHADTGTPIWALPGRSVPPGKSPSARAVRQWRALPAAALRLVLAQEHCSFLIVQEYEDARFDRLVRLGRRWGLAVFATFQGGDRTLSRVEKLVRKRSLELAHGLIVASTAERHRLRRAYPRLTTPVAAIANPVDTDAWAAIDRTQARRDLGLHPDEFIAINHGRIDIERKGHDVLLRAWTQGLSGTLVLIGSGQDDDALDKLIVSYNIRNVRWERRYVTSRDYIRRWLSAADVYVSASRIEGMAVAPLEAMACGLPVIATKAQGMEEIIGTGFDASGILVAVDSDRSLASAIGQLRHNEACRLLYGKAAIRRASERFSVPSVGREIAKFID